MNYDYIIVGAGSSGCALARQLSDDPTKTVLLLEAGGDNQESFVKMPGGFMKLFGNKRFFWFFPVKPHLGRDPEKHNYGRGLGGSSAVNGTWYLRGMPKDYYSWAERGLTAWSWDKILPVFQRMESYRERGAHKSRGKDGPLQITEPTYRSKVMPAVFAAANSLGMKTVGDINEPGISGIGWSQYTVSRRSRRASAYEAFLAPVRKSRPNLTIRTGSFIKRILIENGRATGVLCEENGKDVIHRADRDVVISAGVYMSPAILQRSGVGPADLLAQHGIAQIADLPAVGQNLTDHQMVTLTYKLHNDPGMNREFTGWRLYKHAISYFLLRRGLLARVGAPVTMLMSSEGDPSWPDMQLSSGPFAMKSSKRMKSEPGRGPLDPEPSLMFSGFHLRPKSLGSVQITSSDPSSMPLIEPGWWKDDFDRDKALKLVRLLRDLAASDPMKQYVGEEKVPGKQYQSDADLTEELKWMLSPGLHGTGTCSMGLDPATSVVDERCRVHGIKGLRVVDCSIMPTTVSGNTNGPAMAIGLRAGELMLEDAAQGT